MYLHDDFIKLIKSRFAYAHPGNVNQLLESFNKLARDGVSFSLETDYVANCEQLRCCYERHTSLVQLPMLYTDVECVLMCRKLVQVRSCLL